MLMMHVVVNGANQWELMCVSNTTKWKTYINKALERGEPFTMLVRHHTKLRHAAEVVIEE
jgi:hypothetical protein